MKEFLPHQLRVIDECTTLEEKIFKLQAFLDSQNAEKMTISQDEYNLLSVQLSAMKTYSFILQLRINAF